jgi:hypothetical protein
VRLFLHECQHERLFISIKNHYFGCKTMVFYLMFMQKVQFAISQLSEMVLEPTLCRHFHHYHIVHYSRGYFRRVANTLVSAIASQRGLVDRMSRITSCSFRWPSTGANTGPAKASLQYWARTCPASTSPVLTCSE